MNKDQLQRETQMRIRMAPVPVLAAILFALAAVTGAVGTHPKVAELTLDLLVAHKRFPLDLIGSVVNGAVLLALGAVLSFLWRATSARKPGFSAAVKYVAIAGAALAAISGVVYAVSVAVVANKFATTGQQTYQQAHDLTSSAALLVLPLLGQAALLLLAVATVLVCLNAMRVGLLPKLMGYLGIVVGVLFLFPIGALAPLIQAAWLGALGYLFFGRWPSGHPPAWSSGVAVPWPSNQQARQPRPARGGRGKPVPAPTPEPAIAPAAGTTRATTPKRKRKRRN
jgi:hypothetical protein